MKKVLKTIISLLLIISLDFGIFWIYNIEKKKVNEENAQTQGASNLPLPSRIVYKNKYNQYKIMNSEDKYFAKVYSLLYNQPADYTEDQTELLEENVSFIECTYIVRDTSKEDKRYIFLLGDKNNELEKSIQFYTKDSKKYEFGKKKSYTSKKQVSKVPSDAGFWKKWMVYIKRTGRIVTLSVR